MKWKKFDIKKIQNLKEDKQYLVVWQSLDGIFSRPHNAYWDDWTEVFISLENNNSHPLQVTHYLEYPNIEEQYGKIS